MRGFCFFYIATVSAVLTLFLAALLAVKAAGWQAAGIVALVLFILGIVWAIRARLDRHQQSQRRRVKL